MRAMMTVVLAVVESANHIHHVLSDVSLTLRWDSLQDLVNTVIASSIGLPDHP